MVLALKAPFLTVSGARTTLAQEAITPHRGWPAARSAAPSTPVKAPAARTPAAAREHSPGWSLMKDLYRLASSSAVMYLLGSSGDLKSRSYLPDRKNSEAATSMPMTTLSV